IIAHHISNLAIRLNDNNALGQTTELRLRQAQLRNKSTKSILSIEGERLRSLKDTHNLLVK
ncbi:10907_t:CDS:1, partial [Dentiscutata heterogama]